MHLTMKPKESEKSSTRKDNVKGQNLLSILVLGVQIFRDLICWVFSSIIVLIFVCWKKYNFVIKS